MCGDGANVTRFCSSNALMKAGFTRSVDTESFLPLRSITNCFRNRFKTRNGPSYGDSSPLRWRSTRTKTWLQVSSPLGMYGLIWFALVSEGLWFRKCVRNCETKLSGVTSVAGVDAMSSPGRHNDWPYTSSAGVQPMSSLTAFRIPNKMIGSSSDQRMQCLVMMDALRSRWKRSTRPFACGW